MRLCKRSDPGAGYQDVDSHTPLHAEALYFALGIMSVLYVVLGIGALALSNQFYSLARVAHTREARFVLRAGLVLVWLPIALWFVLCELGRALHTMYTGCTDIAVQILAWWHTRRAVLPKAVAREARKDVTPP